MTQDDIAARKTYRYVRLGMIAAVVLIGASVWKEQLDAPGTCWQTSISAYYYTPVRAVLVASLAAIGLSLVVIKGTTTAEDICLNVAGMLAPVVAFVPTSDHGRCWSIEPVPLPTIDDPAGDDPLAGWVLANIDNNVQALLFAGLVAFTAAGVIAGAAMVVGKDRRARQQALRRLRTAYRGTAIGLGIAAVFLAAGAWLYYEHRGGFVEAAHASSAFAMFAFLAGASAANAWDAHRKRRRLYPSLYALIVVVMAGTAGLLLHPDWDHKVLVVEILEIVWFAALWIVQTRELWHTTLRPGPEAD